MAKNLVIVESPAKAKTIEGFLGKDFLVKSSFGHVMDLAKKNLGVDIENGFIPNYEISSDKKKIVTELKKLAKEAEMVWLASDEDREGEAISWHLFNALNLEDKKTQRIVFHEITKTAITDAIQNPRKIDKHLVDAQQARRVLDRLVGFELSPLLWKKVKPSLSAGRVQSVAVRLIVDREEEIKNFVVTSNYRVIGIFEVLIKDKTIKFSAEVPKRFESKEEVAKFLEKCKDAAFTVKAVEKKPGKKSPAPPFTTSTLQQEASRKLGFSVANTMRVAQQLYESGRITYMRTDSVNLSGMAIAMAKEEITKLYGEEYVKIRQYKTKSKGAQEAHEAIRPTYLNQSSIDGDASQKRLYDLIWKRTVASQMSDAQFEKTNVDIEISNHSEKFVARGEVIKFDGFLKLYMESTDDENGQEQEGVLPPLKSGDKLKYNEINGEERFTQHPARYTEASLVRQMEELGIGRPSTYAPTISTIQKREYVVREDRDGVERKYNCIQLKGGEIKAVVKKENTGFEKSKLFPTDIGILVTQFLMQYFDDIMDFNFTASVELEFDEIADGKKVWNSMISDFYGPFHSKIENTQENSKKFSGEKLLGIDPVSGQNIYVKIGRYGAMAQIGESESEEKPKFAGLKKDQSIDDITIEEVLELFKFPRLLGEYQGAEVKAAIGRFGPYVTHEKLFYSLDKTDDPVNIDLERAIEIIELKKQKVRESVIKEFKENKDVKVLVGRYGPYISIKKQNFKIPKGVTPEELTLEDCIKISEDPKNAPKKKFVRKKK